MQILDGNKLRAAFKKRKESNPNLVCDHPKVEKERMFGSDTEDRICTTCGEVRPRTMW